MFWWREHLVIAPLKIIFKWKAHQLCFKKWDIRASITWVSIWFNAFKIVILNNPGLSSGYCFSSLRTGWLSLLNWFFIFHTKIKTRFSVCQDPSMSPQRALFLTLSSPSSFLFFLLSFFLILCMIFVWCLKSFMKICLINEWIDRETNGQICPA